MNFELSERVRQHQERPLDFISGQESRRHRERRA